MSHKTMKPDDDKAGKAEMTEEAKAAGHEGSENAIKPRPAAASDPNNFAEASDRIAEAIKKFTGAGMGANDAGHLAACLYKDCCGHTK